MTHRTKRRGAVAAAALALGLGALSTPPAGAAFPGQNGKLIAFARFPRNNSPWEEIFVIKSNGTGLIRLTHNNGNQVSDVAPVWNPAGTRIAYTRCDASGDCDILIMTPGGNIVGGFTGPAVDAFPAWSPDGTKIAFSRGGIPGDIYWKSVNGAVTQQVTTTALDHETRPAWSPAGDEIAFEREDAATGMNQVWVATLNASFQPTGQFLVTDDPQRFDGNPEWAPDATQLAVDTAKAGTDSDIRVYDMTVSPPVGSPLIQNPLDDFHPAFSPTGRFLVWARGPEEQDTELVRKNLVTGAVFVLTGNQVVDQQPDWQPVP
jgi:TolB protein